MKIIKRIIIVIVIMGLFFLGKFLIIPVIQEQREMYYYCEEIDLFQCSYSGIECYEDCNRFGLNYFKYDTDGWGDEECWCRELNGTKQIW